MADETKETVKRIGRGQHLHRVIPILDASGKVIDRVVKPLMVELRARDVFQVIVGASILAIPAGFTEETWNLGEELAMANIGALAAISIAFVALFVYSNFYRGYIQGYRWEFVKRVVVIYTMSLAVVAVLLTLIGKCPWGVDNLLALKRIVIVGLPSSLSAAVSDALK
ncbi:MAG: DUF2391 family protein [Thermoanaerobaculales bacterium]|jgi:uncharacterized membrane protein|nr:DUF2391 family protein [Thermoanaerobaculales bacterium]